MQRLYKIMTRPDWQQFHQTGSFAGSADDLRDGFIHLSSEGQWRETLQRHFANQPDLVLLSLQEERLVPQLKWEPSRGGQLFPHFYAPLELAMIEQLQALELKAGIHQLTDDVTETKG